jgi:hypothetical protein
MEYTQIITTAVTTIIVAGATYFIRGFFDFIEKKRVHLESIKALSEALSDDTKNDIIKELIFTSTYQFKKPLTIKEINAILKTKSKNEALLLYKTKRPAFEIVNDKLRIKKKYIKTFGNTRYRKYQAKTLLLYISFALLSASAIQVLTERNYVAYTFSKYPESHLYINQLIETTLYATIFFSVVFFFKSLRDMVMFDIRQEKIDDLYR